MEKKQARKNVPLSRTLTKILRHTASKLGLDVASDGYVKIEDIVKIPAVAKFKPTMEILEDVVKHDNKKRLQISEDKQYIRAVQGHTIQACVSPINLLGNWRRRLDGSNNRCIEIPFSCAWIIYHKLEEHIQKWTVKNVSEPHSYIIV